MELIEVLDQYNDIIAPHLIHEIFLEVDPKDHLQLKEISLLAKTYFDDETFFDTYVKKYTHTHKYVIPLIHHIRETTYLGSLKHGDDIDYNTNYPIDVYKGMPEDDIAELVLYPMEITPYKYGIIHGDNIEYYLPTYERGAKGLPGSIDTITSYRNGLKNGKSIIYRLPDPQREKEGLLGSVFRITSYTDGLKHGEEITYKDPTEEQGSHGLTGEIKSISRWYYGKKV